MANKYCWTRGKRRGLKSRVRIKLADLKGCLSKNQSPNKAMVALTNIPRHCMVTMYGIDFNNIRFSSFNFKKKFNKNDFMTIFGL